MIGRWIEDNLLAPLVMAGLASVWWIVRKVFTNDKAISLLQQEVKKTNESIERLASIQEGLVPVVKQQIDLLQHQTDLLAKLADIDYGKNKDV